jgi:hypothetical protein
VYREAFNLLKNEGPRLRAHSSQVFRGEITHEFDGGGLRVLFRCSFLEVGWRGTHGEGLRFLLPLYRCLTIKDVYAILQLLLGGGRQESGLCVLKATMVCNIRFGAVTAHSILL